MFAVSHCLSAPLLDLAKAELDGVNFSGTSSSGKSTAGQFIGASLFGDPEKYAIKWWMTANAIEGACALYNDLPLIVDELGQATPSEIGELIYHVAGGVGKQRLDVQSVLKRSSRFRNKLLSTGEVTVAERMRDAGKTMKAGQEIRMVDIPVSGTYGLFEKLYGHKSARQFADVLRKNTYRYYGTVGREFISHIAENWGAVKSNLDSKLPIYSRYLEKGVSDMTPTDPENRVVNRWALAVFAGELASELGLTGWKRNEAKESVLSALRSWLKANSGGA